MHDIFIVDLGSHDHNIQSITAKYPHAQLTRFYGDVLSTLTRCARKANTKHYWFIISCANIENFDLDLEYEAVDYRDLIKKPAVICSRELYTKSVIFSECAKNMPGLPQIKSMEMYY